MQNHSTSPIKSMVRPSSYVIIAVLSALNLVILAFSRAELLATGLPMFFLQGVTLLVMFLTARRMLNQSVQPNPVLVRLHYAFEGLFFLHIAWLSLRLLNHLSMMIPFPYADALLTGWDQALGLDWLGYFNFVMANPALMQVLDIAYTSLTALSIVFLLLLVSFGYMARAREFIDTFLITAVICIVIGAAFPAKAAVLTLIPDFTIFAQMGSVPGVYHMPYMDALRDPTVRHLLDPADMPGLATFPSFHTASGILIISACRKTWLSIPAWTYSVVMISATPVFGGHYIVDLIAGTLIALTVVKLVQYANRDKSAAPQLWRAPVWKTA